MKGAKTVDAISWVKEHSPALLPLVIIVCFSTGLAHRAGFHLPFNFTFVNTENFHSSAIEASFDVFFILLALGLGWGTSYFLKRWLESKDHLAIFFCLVMGTMTIATIARASVNFGTHLSLVSLVLYVSLLVLLAVMPCIVILGDSRSAVLALALTYSFVCFLSFLSGYAQVMRKAGGGEYRISLKLDGEERQGSVIFSTDNSLLFCTPSDIKRFDCKFVYKDNVKEVSFTMINYR